MQRAGARDPARKNLSALRDELLQRLHILEIDVLDLLDAELADALPAVEKLLLPALLSATLAAATLAALGGSSPHLHCHRQSPLLAARRFGFRSSGDRFGGASRSRRRERRRGAHALLLRIALRQLLGALVIEVRAHD